MPHMTLEYSTNAITHIDNERLFNTLHVQLAEAGDLRTQDFKEGLK
ncbi:Unknown protein sequence [Pseudomonas syringae pv. maculicola]|uniref:5-carboxymethyl-2-hydroxymuconate isomerase n=1 Tax=Pseudomonas savastanoi pv. glycinea TaxID=318 RepID=A0A3M3G4P1_PSESG|nr:hypothetical protein [Pseudomonas savastanoi]KPB86324.1 Unknown protein sequence [Pseudomonas syringae pv. maculicola]MBN4178234.1 hypothetical protein [Pseudomonas savastanoi pv. phaseolicola]RMM68342.1 hypothetical protein ALQ73_01605 [Pseudomonas savastanoi pv. glycinea]RMR92352.1 hypothetical protein ALP76_01813 [Pseudomonas savastanoi pv. glycinea]